MGVVGRTFLGLLRPIGRLIVYLYGYIGSLFLPLASDSVIELRKQLKQEKADLASLQEQLVQERSQRREREMVEWEKMRSKGLVEGEMKSLEAHGEDEALLPGSLSRGSIMNHPAHGGDDVDDIKGDPHTTYALEGCRAHGVLNAQHTGGWLGLTQWTMYYMMVHGSFLVYWKDRSDGEL